MEKAFHKLTEMLFLVLERPAHGVSISILGSVVILYGALHYHHSNKVFMMAVWLRVRIVISTLLPIELMSG